MAQRYRADVDGLRAIAIAAVVVFHAFPNVLPGGFLGVDIFFVISGYLITGLIRSEIASGTFRVLSFYGRRIRRLVPALLLVLVTTLVAGWTMLAPLAYRHLGVNVAGGALFFANVQFLLQSVYFGPNTLANPLLHLWSLGVEEQFYIAWPFLMLLAATRMRILGLTLSLAVASFVADVFVTSAYSPTAAFYLPFTRFWELMLGATVSIVPFNSKRWASILAPVCLVVIAVSVSAGVVLRADGSAPTWWNLLPTLATSLLIAFGRYTWVAQTLLEAKPMVWLGKISYPLYLWHWPMLSFLAISTLSHGTVVARIVAIGTALILACLTYFFVERPIRFGPDGAQWVPRLVCALLAVAVLGWVDVAAAGFPKRFPEPLRDYLVVNDDFRTDTRSMTCSLPELLPANAYAPECYRPLRRGKRSVLVWGDSFAARLWVGIAASFGGEVEVRQMTRDQCVPLLGQSDFPTCNEANRFVLDTIARYPPDVVVMFAMWPLYGPYQPGSERASALRATIARLHAAGAKHVVVVGPSPLWKANVPSLFARRWRAAPSAGIPAIMDDGLVNEIFTEDKELRSIVPNDGATYVSMTDLLCTTAGCRTLTPSIPAKLMTTDVGHFTKAGALYVVPFLPLRHLLEDEAPSSWRGPSLRR